MENPIKPIENFNINKLYIAFFVVPIFLMLLCVLIGFELGRLSKYEFKPDSSLKNNNEKE